MHQAAIVGEHVREAHEWGWGLTAGATDATGDATPAPIVAKHSWSSLVSAVQLYIKSLNFGYRSRLQKDANIVYANARGKLLSPRTVEATDAAGNTRVYTARKHVAIAVGGRPKYADIPGARELAITSDDIFSLPRAPGRTLIVGAGYIALETAGFLAGLGTEVHVMARGKYLRGFDQDVSAMIVRHMAAHGVSFRDGFVPTRLDKATDSDRVRVTFSDTKPGDSLGAVHCEEFDTVLFAIGREPCTQTLGLEAAGIETDRSGKILLGDGAAAGATADRDPDETTARGVFALGDVGQNRPELTPVAISSAKLLARRLYAPKDAPGDAGALSPHYRTLDYGSTPTTVFTPLEYSCVGWSEEFAAAQLGGHEHIEVFHAHFRPLEWSVPHREDNACYVKIVCQQLDKETAARIGAISDAAAKHDAVLRAMRSQRVVGLHFLGPNAGEVMQGFAVAFQKGLTREDLEYAVGIHPTVAEELLTADITKVGSTSASHALSGARRDPSFDSDSDAKRTSMIPLLTYIPRSHPVIAWSCGFCGSVERRGSAEERLLRLSEAKGRDCALQWSRAAISARFCLSTLLAHFPTIASLTLAASTSPLPSPFTPLSFRVG